MAPIENKSSRGRTAPTYGSAPPSKLAVIAPLMTEGPVTYQTLLEYLDQARVHYQLWLLVQVPAAQPVGGIPFENPPLPAPTRDSATHLQSDPPAFAPVSGVNATPLTWPDAVTPRVVTIQYSGLQINQAINWAIRQAQSDRILVLDAGLNGLLQLRQMLDEISATTSPATTSRAKTSPATPPVAAAPRSSIDAWDLASEPSSPDEVPVEIPAHGAMNRRLLERLEQWAMAIQRTKHRPHDSVPPHKMDLNPPVRRETTHAPTVANDASPAPQSGSGSVQRIDEEAAPALPKKLPKFITRFHEFI
jgi:hypothetical protein